MQRLGRCLLAGVVAFLTGCAGIYGPILDPDVPPFQAVYSLYGDDGEFGDAIVTSRGITDDNSGDDARALISVSVRIANHTPRGARVDARTVHIEWALANGDRLNQDQITAVDRHVSVVADGAAQVDAVFTLPAGYPATSVRAFAVAWSYQREGETYSKLTTFAVGARTAQPVVVDGPLGYPYAPDPMFGQRPYPYVDPWAAPVLQPSPTYDPTYPTYPTYPTWTWGPSQPAMRTPAHPTLNP
ncbi:MAG: hypothetical protein U0271_35390 [Polyangiaceae bacterium]